MLSFPSKFRRLFHVLSRARLEGWVLRGRELSTGKPLSIAYIGTAPLKNYYADLAFAEGFSEQPLGKRSPLLQRFLIALFHRDCSLIVFEINEKNELVSRFLGRTLRNPVWMRMEANISGDLKSCMRRSRYKQVTKQVRKAGLSYEIRTDPEAFEDFYNNLYLPTVESRHGDAGMVAGRDVSLNYYKQGEILMVKRGEERVGGALVDLSQEKPRFMTMGVRDGNLDYVQMGVSSAIYYFLFQRTLERGGGAAVLGSSRGFLKDRPLMFKVSVGASMASFHVEEEGYLYFKVRKITPGLKAFLINNPFFIQDREGKYWAAIFVDTLRSVPEPVRELMETFNQEFVSPRIYSFDPPEHWRGNGEAIKASLGDCSVKSAYSELQ